MTESKDRFRWRIVQVRSWLASRQQITALFPYLSTSLAQSRLTSSPCTADCTVNSQVLLGHHLSLPTLALRCLPYMPQSILLQHLMWGQNMHIDYRDLYEVQTKSSQHLPLVHYITTDWLAASYGDILLDFFLPFSACLLVCVWFCLSKSSFSNFFQSFLNRPFLQ